MKRKSVEQNGRGRAVSAHPADRPNGSLGQSMALWTAAWAAAIIGCYTHPVVAVAATGTAAYLSLRRPVARRIHFIMARYANPGSN